MLGCLSLLVNITRNIMLTKDNDCKVIRRKDRVVVFSALSLVAALNETIAIVSILITVIHFGWKALDGDTIKK